MDGGDRLKAAVLSSNGETVNRAILGVAHIGIELKHKLVMKE